MGAGDTIPGDIQVVGEFSDGSKPVLMTQNQDRVDYHNNSVSPEEKLYVNTALSSRRSKPAQAESTTEPRLRFEPGEKILIQHRAASLEEAIDHDDADLAEIQVLTFDYNRGIWSLDTLNAADQELSTNPTSSNSEFVTIFEKTVPDRRRILICGTFGVIAPENA